MSTFMSKAPVRIGSPEEVACIARVLSEASYDESTICETFKLHDMSDVGSLTTEAIESSPLSLQFKLLAHLFLCPSFVPRLILERGFDSKTIESLLSLGLIGTGEFGQDNFYGQVLLYPVGGFIIASDRHSSPDGSAFLPPKDIVFPAIFAGTLHFLKILPRGSGVRALDLCGGSGIGALALSRSHQAAVSADITERATQFALFNRALNNCKNVEAVCGDLYEPVKGQTFDCITAHPPYVPSVGIETIWRDGGATGELLVQRIIEVVPEYLAPGGIFCCQTQGADTREGKFEERVRKWLGNRANEFDIIFAVSEQRTPQGVLKGLSPKHTDVKALETLNREFERFGIVNMPYGVLLLRRAHEALNHTPWTARRNISDETDGADLEAAFVLHDKLSAPDLLTRLIVSAPRLAPRLQVKITHVVHENSLVPAEFLFEVDKPFKTLLKFEPWIVSLLARLDGRKTLSEIYEVAKAEGTLPEDFELNHFSYLVARTLDAGYTELDLDGNK